MRSRYLLAALSGVFISASALAAGVKDYSIHQHGMSVRAMGMGGAFTAAVDDYSAIFYNPAYLARMEESDTNLSLLHAGVDEKFPSFFSDLGSLSNSNDITQVIDFLGKNSGNHYSARIGLLNAYFARPGWALAVLPVDFSLEMRVGQSVGPQLQLVARQDTTVAYARGWNGKLESGKLSFGATAKAIYRGYFNKSLNAVDVAFSDNVLGPEYAAEGL
ncbi:MAG: hypothetical protein U1E10_17555, partial [Bdellovibrionales bacterium]|nr:hypothetical protein [Bdellovibrionales bacterium]